MLQTPFHAYYKARLLEQLPEEEQFLPVFASSDIEIYPFQIAAASFALRSPYQKGAVLCDEAGMGKSHEAMLVINQKWLEGYSRILLVIPNADLLRPAAPVDGNAGAILYRPICGADQSGPMAAEHQ